MEPETVPDAFEEYARGVKNLEQKIREITEGLSLRPEGTLADELRVRFHNQEGVINNAICKAYQNAMDVAFGSRLADARTVTADLSIAIGGRKEELALRLLAGHESTQRHDFKSEIKQWQNEVSSCRAGVH
jgi:hypothetical protein